MRETLLRLKNPTSMPREVLLSPGADSEMPPRVIGVLAFGAPSIEMYRPSPPLWSTVIPGRYFRNSVTLPSATAPNSSVETTLRMLAAKRCSLIAMAAPLISRDSPTTNRSRRTAAAAGASAISKVVVAPAVTCAGVRLAGAPV